MNTVKKRGLPGGRVTIKSHLIWSLVFAPMPRKMTLYFPSLDGWRGEVGAADSSISRARDMVLLSNCGQWAGLIV
jgi:hypothetical protein